MNTPIEDVRKVTTKVNCKVYQLINVVVETCIGFYIKYWNAKNFMTYPLFL